MLNPMTTQEMQMLNANYASLKAAQKKFLASADSVAAMNAVSSSSNRDTMIPLTSSLYVPARLVPDAELLVDIGTNFLVGKRAPEAKEMLLKKAELLKSNTESLMKVIGGKQQNLETVNEMIMSRKLEASAAASTASKQQQGQVKFAQIK